MCFHGFDIKLYFIDQCSMIPAGLGYEMLHPVVVCTQLLTYAFNIAHLTLYYPMGVAVLCQKTSWLNYKKWGDSLLGEHLIPPAQRSVFFYNFYYFYVVLAIFGIYKPVLRCFKIIHFL